MEYHSFDCTYTSTELQNLGKIIVIPVSFIRISINLCTYNRYLMKSDKSKRLVEATVEDRSNDSFR